MYYLKKYPISLTLIAIIIYLSFFQPPSVGIPLFEGIDKLAHFCMYAGVSGFLWFEFLRNHFRQDSIIWHAWIGAFACPIAMSGLIELLQEYYTSYRGGDWFDLVANTAGVLFATVLALKVLRPFIWKNKKQ